jgi:hypothetical protein
MSIFPIRPFRLSSLGREKEKSVKTYIAIRMKVERCFNTIIPLRFFLGGKSRVLCVKAFILILRELICYNPVNRIKAGESDVHDAGNDHICLTGTNR